VDVDASMTAPCAANDLFAYVDDLGRYPEWMTLVHAATPVEVDTGVWRVELRARVGPLTRSKRLRMRRTEHDPQTGRVRFERDEADGRRHAAWVLDAAVDTVADGARLDMHLHYGGGLWTAGVLERVLADHIASGQQQLLSLIVATR
jgi:hypothetical protein